MAEDKRKKVCMIVQNPMVKGGIAAVVNGYRGSELEKDYKVIYVESYKDGGKITKLFKAIKGYLHFIIVLIFLRPDIVHMHSSFGASFYRSLPFIYLSTWFHRPIINHIHGADFDEFYLNAESRKKNLIKKVYSKCNILIALSQEWKERLKLIVSSEKIRIIENYSIIHEEAIEERLNRECNNSVLFLGEIGRRKGCYDIPLILEMVREQIPNVKFVLCGSGPEEEKIKSLFSGNAVFPGWVRGEEKIMYLREADIFLLPSYNEGMPMSILDAMGYGLPIVSTNVGGIPKIVRNNGGCFEPGDVSSMAKEIINLLKDDEYRKQAIKNSLEIVMTGYSFNTHLSLLEKTYEEIFK